MSRHRLLQVGFVTSATLVLALSVVPAGALTGSTFEVDGNRTVGTGIDWLSPPAHYVLDNDSLTGPGDESFGQGTKEDTAVPTVVSGSIPPNKSDLTKMESGWENLTVTGGATHTFIYLAWTRSNTLGSADMDFELNQSSELTSNGKTSVRSAGDVLITYDFSNGGNAVATHFARWIDSGTCEASGGKAPCWGTLSGDLTGNGADAAISADGTFGELAIDLQASGIVGANACTGFASGYLKSRSSDSFTSALKDFVPPSNVNIVTCQPQVIKIKKLDNATSAVLANAVMQLWKDVDSSGTLNTGDTQVAPDGWTTGTKDCTTTSDGIGNCIFTFSSPSANGTYIAHEVTPPPGYNSTAPDQTQAITVSSTAHTFTLNFNDNKAPATINLVKQDDAGNKVNGAVFKLYVNVASNDTGTPAVPVFAAGVDDQTVQATCTTAGAGADKGKCQMSSVPQGDYWLDETTVPTGYSKGTISPPAASAYPLAVHVGLGTSPGEGQTFTFTAVNPRTHKVIVIVCHEGTDTLASNAVTVGSTTRNSLAAAPSGFTEADLCGLGGAYFGGLGHTTVAPSVVIASH